MSTLITPESFEERTKTNPEAPTRLYVEGEGELETMQELHHAQRIVHFINGPGRTTEVFDTKIYEALFNGQEVWAQVKKHDQIYCSTSLIPLYGAVGSGSLFRNMIHLAASEGVAGKEIYIVNRFESISWHELDSFALTAKVFESNKLFVWDPEVDVFNRVYFVNNKATLTAPADRPDSSIFFNPDQELIEWLIEYADGRIIIDIGAGTHINLAKKIYDRGHKRIVAIEPTLTHMEALNLKRDRPGMHIMAEQLGESLSFLYQNSEYQKTLLIFARPCHSNFVENILDVKGSNVEALYISVERNQMSHLGRYKASAKLLEHRGSSTDNELIYSII